MSPALAGRLSTTAPPGKPYFFYKRIYFCLGWVFVAVRRLSLVLRERGLLLVAVRGLLVAVASLVAEHGL